MIVFRRIRLPREGEKDELLEREAWVVVVVLHAYPITGLGWRLSDRCLFLNHTLLCRYERAMAILEIESMLPKGLFTDDLFFPKWVQVLKPRSGELAEGEPEQWSGRIKQIAKRIERSEEDILSEIDNVYCKVESLEERLIEKLGIPRDKDDYQGSSIPPPTSSSPGNIDPPNGRESILDRRDSTGSHVMETVAEYGLGVGGSTNYVDWNYALYPDGPPSRTPLPHPISITNGSEGQSQQPQQQQQQPVVMPSRDGGGGSYPGSSGGNGGSFNYGNNTTGKGLLPAPPLKRTFSGNPPDTRQRLVSLETKVDGLDRKLSEIIRALTHLQGIQQAADTTSRSCAASSATGTHSHTSSSGSTPL